MPGRRSDNDEERLPWLEPQRSAMPRKPPAPRRSNGGLIAVAGGLAVLAAAGGGYWLGQRDPGPNATATPTDIALAPVSQAPVEPSAPVVSPPITDVATPVETESALVEAKAAPVANEVAVAKSEQPARSAESQRRIRSEANRQKRVRAAQIRMAQGRAAQKRAAENFAAQQRARAARRVPRAWPKMPSPGPAGQVIQLGAFRNPSGANRAYRMRLARYPMLAAMPRVVVPVATKPRGQVLYVLRLGTSSRQQSRIVCRNLKASGDHCLVIG